MGSLLKSTMNTRMLPVGDGRYLRSDVPLALTQEEIAWLREKNFCTLVDLRSAEEVEKNPCALRHEPGFAYIHLPVTGGGGTPKSRAHLHEVYSQMLDAQMEEIIQTILNAKTNVMYFCTAGKDRTGVVSAVLLKKLGAEDQTIIDDYMCSKENLLDMLTGYVAQHPEVELDIIVPQPENIQKVLERLKHMRFEKEHTIELRLVDETLEDAIRAIQRDDVSEAFVDTADTILELHHYGYEHRCIGHTFAIYADGACVGVMLLGEALPWASDPPEMQGVRFYRLMGFVMDKAYRGRGIGGYALEEAIRRCYQDFGVRPIALGVHKDNHRAAAFYLRHGFTKTEYMEGNDYNYLRYPKTKTDPE